jgi:phage terminase large subunit-like protein
MSPGEQAVRFIENLTLVGDYHGQKFRLRGWQKDIVRKLFGTRLPDGRKQYKRMFVGLPRKQAKTTLIAGIAGDLLCGEGVGKQGQQIYSASGDRAQASLIFKTLASMIRADRKLDRMSRIYDGYKRIVFEPLGNSFEALSSEAGLKHGLSPSAVLFDEVHAVGLCPEGEGRGGRRSDVPPDPLRGPARRRLDERGGVARGDAGPG